MTSDIKPAPLWCSSRGALAFISFLGFANLYILRVNLSVAMVCMVNQTAIQVDDDSVNKTTQQQTEDNKCNIHEVNSTDVLTDGHFAWSKETQGLILGSFFWGYFTTQVFGGWLASKFGGKRVYGWFMFACAIATLITPLAARTSVVFLIVMRILCGITQGVVWPAMQHLWAYWAPPLERSKLGGFCFAGSQIGNVICFPMAALLCDYGFDGGWPSIFYVQGGLGLLWFLAWTFIVADSPSQHPRISPEEREYIIKSLENKEQSDKTKETTPWKRILTSRPVWAIVIAHTCANWGTYTFLTNMPTYMREVLKFDIKKNGALSTLPYIGFWLMINVSGFIVDTLRTRQILSTTKARKLANSIGTFVPALFVVALGFIDCTRSTLAVVLLTIGIGISGSHYSGFMVNPIDIAPRHAGIIFGISNTAATIPGFLAPTVIGLITTHQTQEEWQIVFYISAGIYCLGGIVYIILGTGELQPWALDDKEENYTENIAYVYTHLDSPPSGNSKPEIDLHTTHL